MAQIELRECIKQAIAQTEYSGRAINKVIADDLSDRIFQQTGLRITQDKLWSAFRERISTSELNTEEKNAISQFAGYHNWDHFLETTKTPQVNEDTIPYKAMIYIILFIGGIFGILQAIKTFFL